MRPQNPKTIIMLKKVYSLHRREAMRKGRLGSLTKVGDVVIDTVHQKYTVEQVEDDNEAVIAVSHDSGERYRLPRAHVYRESRVLDNLGISRQGPRHDELVAFNKGFQSRIDTDPR
jgi:hypothetical protein